MNKVSVFKGYQIEFNHIGYWHYQCPALKLYGYATEQAIKRAITKKISALSEVN
jgi:hypothetical protein